MVPVPTILLPAAHERGQDEAAHQVSTLSPGALAESRLVPGLNRPEGLLQKPLLAPINWPIEHRTAGIKSATGHPG